MSDRKNRKSKNAGAATQVDWEFVERCLGAKGIRTVYFHGPPGLGKTYAAYHKGRVTTDPYAITLTEETPSAELRGFWAPRGAELVWQDGPVVKALREGARLVLNELACAPPDVLAFLYPILESKETARLTLPTGETIEPSPGFSVVCTSNEPPEALPEALRDRFDCTILIDAPHPEALARLSPELRQAALDTVALDPDRAISLRAWLKLEELRHELGLRDACRAVFGVERGRHVHEALTMKQLEL